VRIYNQNAGLGLGNISWPFIF